MEKSNTLWRRLTPVLRLFDSEDVELVGVGVPANTWLPVLRDSERLKVQSAVTCGSSAERDCTTPSPWAFFNASEAANCGSLWRARS